jgi:hypothetical protein
VLSAVAGRGGARSSILEVTGRLKKDWAADIKSYDEGHVHMLMFADALTEGIKKQFPAKFKNGA